MSLTYKFLRQQVEKEKKKKKIIISTILFLSFLYLIIILIFGDMGLVRYKELKNTKFKLEAQVKEIENENKHLKNELAKFNEDRFYLEKYAREEFGFAKRDEYIFLYDR
jgi:cell division protein FtsB